MNTYYRKYNAVWFRDLVTDLAALILAVLGLYAFYICLVGYGPMIVQWLEAMQ